MRNPLIILLLTLLASTASAQSNALLISEVLFNPVDDGADYVEVYNNGSSAVSLSDIRLAKVNGDSTQQLYTLNDNADIELQPGAYYIITTNAADIMSRYTVRYPDHIIQLSAMPAYNNASGTVMLTDAAGNTIDRLDYSATMHSQMLRDVEGVALERRSFAMATQAANNWYSAASTAGYGTPTYANSQSVELLCSDNDFSLQPEIFSPNGDGFDDLLDIVYQLDDGTLQANATIYDANGRTIRHLLHGAIMGTNGVITWDGLDNDGHRVRRGNYVILFDLYNEKGTTQKVKKIATVMF